MKNARMPGTQIYGRHMEVFGRTPLYSVLWANIALSIAKASFDCHGYLMTSSQSAKIAKNNA